MFFLHTIIVLVLIFDFINGFQDTANSISTILTNKILSPFSTVLMAEKLYFIVSMVFPLKTI